MKYLVTPVLTVPLHMEVVAADAQINKGVLHTPSHRLDHGFSSRSRKAPEAGGVSTAKLSRWASKC